MSLLFKISSSVIEVFILFAKFSTSVGNSLGSPYSANIECISVLCSPGLPKILMIVPFGQSAFSGHSSKVTKTLSPSSAFNVLDNG